jgi:hypothetical protein
MDQGPDLTVDLSRMTVYNTDEIYGSIHNSNCSGHRLDTSYATLRLCCLISINASLAGVVVEW